MQYGFDAPYPAMPGYPAGGFQAMPYWNSDPGYASIEPWQMAPMGGGYPGMPGYPGGGMTNPYADIDAQYRYMYGQGAPISQLGPLLDQVQRMGGAADPQWLRAAIQQTTGQRAAADSPYWHGAAAQQGSAFAPGGGMASAPGRDTYSFDPRGTGQPSVQNPQVPLAHQVNPAVWDSLGPVGKQLAYGAIGQTGQDPEQYEYDLNQSRPKGQAPRSTYTSYARPRSAYAGF